MQSLLKLRQEINYMKVQLFKLEQDQGSNSLSRSEYSL